MERENRKSGLSLALAGAAGGLFFWLTDPALGVLKHRADNPIDAMNEARIGTLLGLGLCGAVLLIGLWMATRKAA